MEDDKTDQPSEFERYRVEKDFTFRREELDLKKRESKRKILDIIILTMVGSLAAIAGYRFQGNVNKELELQKLSLNKELEERKLALNKDLEEQKLRSNLIIEAIKTGNPESAKENLRFFLKTGLLSDPSGRIANQLDQPYGTPFLPSLGLGGNLYTSSADILKFCREKFGASFFPLDGSTIYCTDGARQIPVSRSDICQALYGSREFTTDFGTLTWRCTGAPNNAPNKR